VAAFRAGTHFNNNTFYTTTLTIPRSSYNFPTNAKLRFRCDASNDSDDVYVDLITWRGTSGIAMPDGDVLAARSDGGVSPEMLADGDGSIQMRSDGGAIVRIEPVRELANLGDEDAISRVYPNPFGPSATIEYRLAEETHVSIQIFDAAGRKLSALVDGMMPAGIHTAQVKGTSLTPGVYFYRLSAGDDIERRKLIVLE
jgi:hypothetical protein